jgi:hypothetical protein
MKITSEIRSLNGTIYWGRVTPPDVLDHDVRVIVATDPRKTQR